MVKSSSNLYLSNLDHLRALAAFMVFNWHFLHQSAVCEVLFCYNNYHYVTYNPFLALLEQGNTGVAFFMCISGYIFTRLTDGQSLSIVKFWYNRLLRLFPLLLFWGFWNAKYTYDYRKGSMTPSDIDYYIHLFFHPGGSWTIYLELRYYAVFPLLLFCFRKIRPLPMILLILAGMLVYRYVEWRINGTIQESAYSKLTGRADQFLAGSAAFYIEQWIRKSYAEYKHILYGVGLAGAAGLLGFYEYYHLIGGYYGDYPSPSALWIFIPILEGVFYSAIIIGYLQVSIPKWPDKMLSSIGRWSYSIYLNHFKLGPIIFLWIYTHIGIPEDFYGRLFIGTFLAFPAVVLTSAITYRCIEKPFLRLRTPYLRPLIAQNG